jgi:hypothetical protein
MQNATFALLILGALGNSLIACGPKAAAEPAVAMAPPPSTSAPQTAPVLVWRRFQDPEQRFGIELPGEPVENHSSRKMAGGEAKEQSFLIDLGGRTFGVAITIFSPEFMKDALEGQILAAARKAAATEIDGTVAEDKPVTTPSPDGAVAFNGRQVIVESESMRMVSRNRWILRGPALYRILQSGPTESTRAADFERMVTSFALLGAPPRPE